VRSSTSGASSVHDSRRLLAVIPARGGSKRLPRKNVLLLKGRPLIAWTIEAARASGVLDEALVSTDDEEIAAIARQWGAKVPWLRPAALATDAATSAAVLQHALAWYEAEHGAVSGVVLLQPTSPFRSAASIRGAVESFRAQPEDGRHAVVSVSPAVQHPAWSFRLDGPTMHPFLGWDALQPRSQDLPPAYTLNGAVYVLPAQTIREGAPLVQPGARPFVMNDLREALDIDTEGDWEMA
jgi:CMP-N,N'-diacetyllegionaminic acid synthase